MNSRNNDLDESWDEFEEDFQDDDDSPYIPCPHCQQEIHEDAAMCPYCEEFVTSRSSFPRWVIVVALVVLALMVLPLVIRFF
jgi:hypothetical protein